jgi:hypothetical protein
MIARYLLLPLAVLLQATVAGCTVTAGKPTLQKWVGEGELSDGTPVLAEYRFLGGPREHKHVPWQRALGVRIGGADAPFCGTQFTPPEDLVARWTGQIPCAGDLLPYELEFSSPDEAGWYISRDDMAPRILRIEMPDGRTGAVSFSDDREWIEGIWS